MEHQRQMIIPELQTQVSQGNSQGMAPFGGLSSSFSNQTSAPSVPSYPLHHQQLHPMSTQQSHVLSSSHHPHLRGPNLASNAQHQAFAIRIAKERHIQQQRLLQQHQQQQQFAASNTLMPYVPVQPQLTVSSPQNSSQSQTSSPQVTVSPLTTSSSVGPVSQNPQKHHIPPHIVGRNSRVGGSGSTNQAVKQRQRQSQQQQLQQSGRNHPQQRHQSHSQYQKQSGPSNISHQPQPQQVLYSGQNTSSKQHQQTRTPSENSNQNHVSPVAGSTSTSGQAIPPNQQQRQQSQPHLKLVNQPQPAVQRSLQPNRQVNCDHTNKLQARETLTGLHPTNSFSQIASTAPIPSCVEVTNVISTVSSASAPQLNASEQVSDSSMSNPATPMGSASTPPLTIEPLPPVHQGIEQIHSSSRLPCVGPHGVVQWSEEPLQLEPPTPPPPLEQHQEQGDSKQQQQQENSKQQQQDLKQHSQEQSPLLQGGGNSTGPPQLSN